MELRTELAKENNEILILQDESLQAILFHFIIKRTGQRTDKAHIAELQKRIKRTSKQLNSLMHVTSPYAHSYYACTNPTRFHTGSIQQLDNNPSTFSTFKLTTPFKKNKRKHPK